MKTPNADVCPLCGGGEKIGDNDLHRRSRVCFNASPVTAHPTEAQLYRSAARTGGVQLLDEVETLRGDKDRFEQEVCAGRVARLGGLSRQTSEKVNGTKFGH